MESLSIIWKVSVFAGQTLGNPKNYHDSLFKGIRGKEAQQSMMRIVRDGLHGFTLALPSRIYGEVDCKIDQDADFGVRDHDTRVKPIVGIGGRIDRLFVFARVFGAQLRPGISRMRDVLNRVLSSGCVFRPEVKWAKVNDIEGHAIYPMKRYAHEAPLKHIFTFDIKLDGSVGKCNVGQIRDAIPQDFTETNPFFRSVAEAAQAAVKDLEAFFLSQREQIGLAGFLLNGSIGSQ